MEPINITYSFSSPIQAGNTFIMEFDNQLSESGEEKANACTLCMLCSPYRQAFRCSCCYGVFKFE